MTLFGSDRVYEGIRRQIEDDKATTTPSIVPMEASL